MHFPPSCGQWADHEWQEYFLPPQAVRSLPLLERRWIRPRCCSTYARKTPRSATARTAQATPCPSWFTQQPLAAVGLGYLDPSHRLRFVSPAFDLRSHGWPVFAGVGGKGFDGHAVNARRTLVGLHPFPRTHQVVSGQHRLQQVLGCCRFVLFQGSVRAARRRIFSGRGHRCGRGRRRLLLVSRCSALQRPDSWPPTTASADFCTLTNCVAVIRAVASMAVAACSSLAAGSSPRRLVLDIPVWSDPGHTTLNAHRTRRRSRCGRLMPIVLTI